MIRYAIELLRRLVKSERGQDVVEYALLAGFIGIGLALAFFAFSPLMDNFASAIKNCVDILADPYVCPGAAPA